IRGVLPLSVQLKAQVTEVHSVMSTLVETTDHLITLTKVEEIKQSLHIFSSLIEGIEAIFKVLPKFNINVREPMKKSEQTLPKMTKAFKTEKVPIVKKQTEQTLPKMAKAFENETLPIVEELTSDSLQPALISIRDRYADVLKEMN